MNQSINKLINPSINEYSSEELDPKVQNCVDCYTSDWVVVTRKYQQYSSSVTIRLDNTGSIVAVLP